MKHRIPLNPSSADRLKQETERLGTGETLCGYINDDGELIPFVMPEEASDVEVALRTFELKNGRPMNTLESRMLDLVVQARETQA